jgi:photosynthetic reaction center H subunit
MLAFVGPGSYAQRSNKPDMMHGKAKIVPLRVAGEFSVASEDPDPRGWTVVAGDGRSAGVVKELWLDRMEILFRYLEVEIPGGKRVLLPMNFSTLNKSAKTVEVSAIMSHQFANVPMLANPDSISLLEEDKITAYYGAGTLYADAQRAEPLL